METWRMAKNLEVGMWIKINNKFCRIMAISGDISIDYYDLEELCTKYYFPDERVIIKKPKIKKSNTSSVNWYKKGENPIIDRKRQ